MLSNTVSFLLSLSMNKDASCLVKRPLLQNSRRDASCTVEQSTDAPRNMDLSCKARFSYDP